jgi:DNA polymerase III subunit delta
MPRAKASEKRVSPTVSNVVAVLGSDDGEIRTRARALAAELMPPDAGDFGVDTIDGAADNTEQAAERVYQTIQALKTMPFFGGNKLVWLKDVNFMGESVAGRSAKVLEALEALKECLAAGVPENVTFLINAIDVDKRRAFYKSLSSLGRVEVFDKIDTSKSGWEEQAESVARVVAKERGLKFSGEALELFVRLAGADSRQIKGELEKIDLYLGEERKIEEEVVRQLVAKSTSSVIWELSHFISRKNLGNSLALLDELLFQGEMPIGILYAAIIPTVRNLLMAKDLLETHRLRPPQAPFYFGSMLNRLPEEATRHLPRKKDGTINAYGLGLAACEVRRFTLDQLKEGMQASLDANMQLVTTQLEPRLVLSQLLVKLLAGGSQNVECRIEKA